MRPDLVWHDMEPTPEALNEQGREHMKRGEHAKAIAKFDEALALDQDYVVAWNNKGYCLLQLASYDGALRCFEHAIELDPLDSHPLVNKGLALAGMNQHDAAIHAFEQAIAVNPSSTHAWYNKALAHERMGDEGAARNAFQHVVDAASTDTGVKSELFLGNALAKLGDLPGALRVFEAETASDPTNVDAWNNKAYVLGEMGDHEREIACYQEALKVNPNDLGVWANIGHAALAARQFEGALKVFHVLSTRDARNNDAWTGMGTALEGLGQPEKALACYERSMAIDPHDSAPREKRERLLARLEKK